VWGTGYWCWFSSYNHCFTGLWIGAMLKSIDSTVRRVITTLPNSGGGADLCASFFILVCPYVTLVRHLQLQLYRTPTHRRLLFTTLTLCCWYRVTPSWGCAHSQGVRVRSLCPGFYYATLPSAFTFPLSNAWRYILAPVSGSVSFLNKHTQEEEKRRIRRGRCCKGCLIVPAKML
jgi:hypothetical protein